MQWRLWSRNAADAFPFHRLDDAYEAETTGTVPRHFLLVPNMLSAEACQVLLREFKLLHRPQALVYDRASDDRAAHQLHAGVANPTPWPTP